MLQALRLYAPGPAAWSGQSPLVDVNAATVEQLAGLPGFDLDRAYRTVAERQVRSGFGSLEEFAIAANLPPHQFAPLRQQLTCAPPQRHSSDPPPGQAPQGRILDV